MTIDRLKVELAAWGPELEKKGRAVAEGLVVLEKEAKEVEATQQEVGAEAEIVGAQKADAEAIKSECE